MSSNKIDRALDAHNNLMKKLEKELRNCRTN